MADQSLLVIDLHRYDRYNTDFILIIWIICIWSSRIRFNEIIGDYSTRLAWLQNILVPSVLVRSPALGACSLQPASLLCPPAVCSVSHTIFSGTALGRSPGIFFSTVSALCLCVLCVCDLCVSAGCVLLPSHCSTDVTAPSRPDLAAPSHAHLAASSCAISKHLAPRGIISYQSGSTLRSRSTILCRPHSTILCHHIVLLLQHCCVAMGCAWRLKAPTPMDFLDPCAIT